MRARLPWVLLTVSLAANLFFAAGVAYTVYTERRVAESVEARVDLVADRLGLSEAQREALSLLRERAALRRDGMRDRSAPMRRAILDQVAAPDFDRARVLALLDDWGGERRLYFAEFAEDLHDFVRTLDAGQRERFLAMAQEPGFLRQVSTGAGEAEEPKAPR